MKQSVSFWACVALGLLCAAFSIASPWYLVPTVFLFLAAYLNFERTV